MATRSPLLGYNHNVGYAGHTFHVQTEDSGLSNPHVFTHLFVGGTILGSKRADYRPNDEEQFVKQLMQGQHKAMLRDLRAGKFDDRIATHFGEPVQHATQNEDPVDLMNTAPTSDTLLTPTVNAATISSEAAAPEALMRQTVLGTPEPRSTLPRQSGDVADAARTREFVAVAPNLPAGTTIDPVPLSKVKAPTPISTEAKPAFKPPASKPAGTTLDPVPLSKVVKGPATIPVVTTPAGTTIDPVPLSHVRVPGVRTRATAEGVVLARPAVVVTEKTRPAQIAPAAKSPSATPPMSLGGDEIDEILSYLEDDKPVK